MGSENPSNVSSIENANRQQNVTRNDSMLTTEVYWRELRHSMGGRRGNGVRC